MSKNKMSFHLVTVQQKNHAGGSGVIFASHDRSPYYYVLTARHNFDGHLSEPSLLKDDDLEIFYQGDNKIITSGLKIYFLEEKYDLALVVFKFDGSSLLRGVKKLRIYNVDSDVDYKKRFVVIGYPVVAATEDFKQRHKSVSARVDNYYEDQCLDILKDDGASTTHAIKLETEYYAGMSGGGVFFEDQYRELQLRSIIKQYSGDSFSCVRLDCFVDELNLKIKQYSASVLDCDLDEIETGDVLFAGDEPIEVDEITNFDYFKDGVNERVMSKKMWDRYELGDFYNSNYELDKEKLRSVAKILRDKRDKVKQETDDLSYFFSYIAIASHANKDYRLSTNYFLEATRLNPKHTQTLLLEKYERVKHERKDQIKDIEVNSLADLERKFELLLAQEENDDLASKRPILIEALNVARTIKDKKDLQVIYKFEEALIENYKHDNSLRPHHKYKELGDYFYNAKLVDEEVSVHDDIQGFQGSLRLNGN